MATIPEEDFSSFSIRDDLTAADARLALAYEHKNQNFVQEVVDANKSQNAEVALPQVENYLLKMERGGQTQSFGWLLVVETDTGHNKILAHSGNAPEVLEKDRNLQIGVDMRKLFAPASAAGLEEAIKSSDYGMVNPVRVLVAIADKQFYAVLHKHDLGVMIDFEPVVATGETISQQFVAAPAPHELASGAIKKMEEVPTGELTKLSNTVVEEVRKMTGYDRVMVYKFYPDEHGEVIAESKRPDMEPYLGLHYPATDLPQASRFFLMLNKVRIIDNANAPQPQIVQDPSLDEPIRLATSQLRPVHPCHVEYMQNMGSMATLMLAVVVKDTDYRTGNKDPGALKLWGLIVCHHESSRFLPYPLRQACVFLTQMFALQVEVEDELSAQLSEKHILRIQTMLCSMLLRDAPIGVVTQSPNITDLIKCDGAALLYKGKLWLLGTTPKEDQVRSLVSWVLEKYKDSTGLSTDSLTDAGFPDAKQFADKICGMACVRITDENDLLFWFRGPFEKEVKWAGAPHNLQGKEPPRRPRASFAAFVQVVQGRSMPWEDLEVDAIHSLQMLLRDNLTSAAVDSELNSTGLASLRKSKHESLDSVKEEIERLSESAAVPIAATDAQGRVISWNRKMSEITGLSAFSAIGRHFAKDLVHPDSASSMETFLELSIDGAELHSTQVKLLTSRGEGVPLNIRPCRLRDHNGSLLGIYLVGMVVSDEQLFKRFTKIGSKDEEDVVLEPSMLTPPIFGCDLEEKTTHWNQPMVELTGVSAEEVMGLSLADEVIGKVLQLEDDEAVARFKRRLQKAQDGKAVEKRPFVLFDRQGAKQEALLTINKRRGADSSVKGFMCFIHKPKEQVFRF